MTTRGPQRQDDKKLGRFLACGHLHQAIFFERVSVSYVEKMTMLLLCLKHQLPLQLHWILPGQAGGAVAASLAGRVGVDDFIAPHGADSLLHGRHQALHTQVLNTVGPCKHRASARWAAQTGRR